MEANKERTLAKCSCCQQPMWSNGGLMWAGEWRRFSAAELLNAPLSVCNPCKDEADDQGITVEQLRERNNERSVETESY